MRYRVKYLFEYAALRGAAALLNALPYRAALMVAWVLAGFAYHVVRFRRRETFRRITQFSDGQIRFFGLTSMLAGMLLLLFAK